MQKARAYHIVEWKRLYELTDKGRPAPPDHPFEGLRKTPIPYLRHSDNGLLLSPAWLKMLKFAWPLGTMMDAATYGIWKKLLDVARDKPRMYRGWILDDKSYPLNPWQFAEIVGFRDSDYMKPIFDLLCHPAIAKLELLQVPGDFPIPPNSAQQRENAGIFQDETETEDKVNNNLNERDTTRLGGGQGDQLSPPPPSVMDSVMDSGDTVSVSGSAPKGGEGRKKEIATAKQQFLLKMTGLIQWHNQSDRTTILDIAEQLEHRIVYETKDDLFSEAIEKARGCSRIGRNPLAMFVSAMKKSPFYYIPKGTSFIRGAKDKYNV